MQRSMGGGPSGSAPEDGADRQHRAWTLGEGIIDHEIYSTDQFRIAAFKVLSCSNRGPHDWCVAVGPSGQVAYDGTHSTAAARQAIHRNESRPERQRRANQAVALFDTALLHNQGGRAAAPRSTAAARVIGTTRARSPQLPRMR
jgi:hypothetical protein